MVSSTKSRRRLARVAAGICALTLVLGACGGGDDDDDAGGDDDTEQGDDDAPAADADRSPQATLEREAELTPTPGGSITYALEADNTGGWCLAEAQLAISGIQVARALYDTLTAPDENGEIQPFLAQSVTPNEEATQFTITLREGITFHDGSALTAEVVKNNIDAWRGAYEARSPLLFTFVFDNVASVDVVDDLTLTVTTNEPWPAFPWFLFSSGRLGIMAQAQLDSENCNTNLIGTGPFTQGSWEVGEGYTVEKNATYWRTDEAGNALPYLDSITFVPVESGPDRVTGLQAGDYDVIHTSGAIQIVEIRDDDSLVSVESDQFGELSYSMLNGTKPPFDNILARQAMAYAINREEFNEARNEGILQNAQGPFAPGNVGYLEDAGLPEYDPDMAAQLVQQYTEETGLPFEFTLTHSADPETTRSAELVQQYAQAVGATVSLATVGDQSALINVAIGKDYQAVLWRNHPGGDPDTQYVWWHCNAPEGELCDNPVNFGGWNDPEINALLEEGRTTVDPAARQEIYENLNRQFAESLWNLWGQFTIWSIASNPSVHGVMGVPLPDGGAQFPGLATGHPVSGMWVEQ